MLYDNSRRFAPSLSSALESQELGEKTRETRISLDPIKSRKVKTMHRKLTLVIQKPKNGATRAQKAYV